ncbi:acetyltransferase [Fictibacillus phosphorivorans]|uniref:acetyltransferase n=1 Tax=Fictibacillus phosphorivorans TaxID=1221500 RepID=UPI003CF5EA9B
MKNKLLIIGASGHGKVVADIAVKMERWQEIAFLDDDESITTSMGFDVIGSSDEALKYIDDYEIFIGIGNNDIRQKVQENLEINGAIIPVLTHPNIAIGEQVEVGAGTVVMAGAVVNCCTKIGKGCIINTGSTIDHDNCIEDFVHISPGAHLAGTVKVGRGSWLGIGSIVSNNINIPNGCKIGAGAVVVKNITQSGVYVGTPAKRLD